MAPREVILLALRLAVGGVFIYAGGLKILDPQEFARAIEHYELTSRSVSVVAAIYLPWLEIVAGFAVFPRRWRLGALTILAGLMVVFIAALASAWARGLDVSCGCFGRSAEANETNYPLFIGRDLLLLAAIGILLVAEWRAAVSARLAGRIP